MGVRITDDTHVCLFCSTKGEAFGPVFEDRFEVEEFLDWLDETDGRDPREIPGGTLQKLYASFSTETAADDDGEPTDVQIYGAGSR